MLAQRTSDQTGWWMPECVLYGHYLLATYVCSGLQVWLSARGRGAEKCRVVGAGNVPGSFLPRFKVWLEVEVRDPWVNYLEFMNFWEVVYMPWDHSCLLRWTVITVSGNVYLNWFFHLCQGVSYTYVYLDVHMYIVYTYVWLKQCWRECWRAIIPKILGHKEVSRFCCLHVIPSLSFAVTHILSSLVCKCWSIRQSTDMPPAVMMIS